MFHLRKWNSKVGVGGVSRQKKFQSREINVRFLFFLRFADFGTILEIKDWVLMSNGCSILSTVGIRRFRTLSRGERDGYETARVKFLTDEPISETCLSNLKELHDKVREKAVSWVKTFNVDFKEQVISSFGTIPEVEDNWSSLPDGPSWTWWLLAILPLGPLLQVRPGPS